MLNNGKAAANVTCDSACFQALGVTSGNIASDAHASNVAELEVRDLWTHTSVGNTTATNGWTSLVAGEGASVMLKITPVQAGVAGF
jgi:hypothetical protein